MAAFLWAGLIILAATGAPHAQEDVLAPQARHDVLKHKLNIAIKAKEPKQIVGIIAQLRKSGQGVSGETLFYEARAHHQLKNWKAAYRALVTYLNNVGRKGRNYKAGIALFVETEGKIKKKHRVSEDLARTDRVWTTAATAYDRISKQRNAWKEKVKTFGVDKDDMAWAIARRANGGFLVGGTFELKANKQKKRKAGRFMVVTAFSRDGRIAWNRIVFGRGDGGSIRSLTALPKGGFLIGGVNKKFQIAARIDSQAIPIFNHKGVPWISAYGRSKDGSGGIVLPAGKQGFIAIGAETIVKDGKSPRLPFAVRISKDGKALGKTVYAGSAARYWHDITDATTLPNGDVVVVGETRPLAAWDTRPGMGYLLRITPEGKVVWARRVPADAKDGIRFSSVARAHGGGVIAVGRQGSRLFLFKSDDGGEEEWRTSINYRDLMPRAARELCTISDLASLVQKTRKQNKQRQLKSGRITAVREMACRSGKSFASAASVVPRKNGYLILGFQGVGDRKKTDIRLIAIDNWGKVLWDKVYGHDGFDFATGALVTEDGGAIVVGATDSVGTGKRDFLLFKIDRNGGFAPWAKLGPQAKPKPAKKKKVTPAPDTKKQVKAKPPAKPKPEAKAKEVKEDGAKKRAPRKQAKAKPPAKAKPAKKKKATPAPDVKKQAKAKPPAKPQPKAKAKAKEDGAKKKALKKQAKAKLPAKPKPAKKKKATPAPDVKKEAKAEPPAKPEPKTKADEDGSDDGEAPKKEARAKEGSAPQAPGAKKAATNDAVPAVPPADESDDPPSTSFSEIFGSVFGDSDEKKPSDTQKSKPSEKEDE